MRFLLCICTFLMGTALFLSVGGWTTPRTALAYTCPPPAPPRGQTFSLDRGALLLKVDARGVATLLARFQEPRAREGVRGASSPRSVPHRVVWKGARLGFVPDWVFFDRRTGWLLVIGFGYGIEMVDPKGRVLVRIPYTTLLTKRDLRKAGWKCGSWWAVSVRATFLPPRRGRHRRNGRHQADIGYVRLRFHWGRVVQVAFPSGRFTRWRTARHHRSR